MQWWPILCLAAAAPPAASALDLFPLSEGTLRTYEYVTATGTDVFSTYFDGTELVGGAETQVLRFSGGVDDGLEQFWSESVQGDKYLHGTYRSDCQCGTVYDPPIQWIDAPLALYKAWDVTTNMVGWGSVTLHFRVTGAGPTTVPAGTFDGFTIEWTTEEPPPLKTAGRDLTGRRLPPATPSSSTFETYADAAGMIRSVHGSTTSSLQQFHALAVETSTWTRVRELYR